MTFRDKLIELEACNGAVKWVGERTAQQAWAECDRSSWMMWLLAKMSGKKGWPDHKTVVGIACDCAETALHLVPAGEDRPRIAIETARKWIDGEASEENVIDAACAAFDVAYGDDCGSGSAYAAHAAVRAAANAAYAAEAEYDADDADAADAACCASRAVGMGHIRKLADMIRAKVPTIPEVE